MSVHGLETMRLEMGQRRGQKSLRPIHVAIQHQPNRGQQSPCGQVFTDHVSEEQKRLSDAGEKDIGKYRAVLSNVFEQLSEAEQKQCEDAAVEWNTRALPDELQHK